MIDHPRIIGPPPLLLLNSTPLHRAACIAPAAADATAASTRDGRKLPLTRLPPPRMQSPLLQHHQQQLDCGRSMRGGPADVAVDLHGAADPSVTSPASSYFDTAFPLKGYVRTADANQIYFEVHGLPHGTSLEQAAHRPKVVMLMGLACGCSAWRWQLQDLVQQHKLEPDYVGSSSSSQEQRQQQPRLSDPDAQRHWQHEHAVLQPVIGQQQEMLVCILDNRGVGRSSSPLKAEAYSTQLMAQDTLAVMDHLRWGSAHLLGFSMGGFIAQRLAVAAPQRVLSLTLLSSSAGGLEIVPFTWSGLRIAMKMVMARSPEDAVDATLAMHFRRRTLTAWVSHMRARRHDLLRREYLTPTAAGGPPQPPHGFKGQLAACWRHRLSKADADAIVRAGFPVLVIHGRNDKLASAANAERLARRLACPCVILPGAHFIVRECAGQINLLLSQLVLGARHIHAIPNHTYLDPSPAMQQAWRQGAAQPLQGGKQGDAAALTASAADGGSACSSGSNGRHASAALPADARDLCKVR